MQRNRKGLLTLKSYYKKWLRILKESTNCQYASDTEGQTGHMIFQMEILELKSTINELKNSVERLCNRCEIAEEKNRSIEII